MPNKDTFTIPPIADFVSRWLHGISVDPFARNSKLATYTNDLNPEIEAQYNLPANEFLNQLVNDGVVADVIIFDPPYSSQQAKEVYSGIGKEFLSNDNINVIRWTREKEAAMRLCKIGTIVLSFGWNTTGMGRRRGFTIEEVLIVNHAGAHNDTICMAEKLQVVQESFAL